jgi:hypothetical protein
MSLSLLLLFVLLFDPTDQRNGNQGGFKRLTSDSQEREEQEFEGCVVFSYHSYPGFTLAYEERSPTPTGWARMNHVHAGHDGREGETNK